MSAPTVTLSIPDLDDGVDMLTAALAYADAGWYVLPVKRGTKDPGSVVGKHWQAQSSRDPRQIAAWFAGTDHGIVLHRGRSDLGAAAVQYAQWGIPVLPLWPRSKQPHIRHGFLSATTDVDTIAQWWSDNPDDNIGLRPPPGFVVLDEDPRDGGDVRLAQICRRHGPLPDTWIAHTGGGGRHIWLRATPPFRGRLAAGIDLKHHESGYLVAPPSVHPSGARYVWENDNDVAWAPVWLRALLAPRRYPQGGTRTARDAIGLVGVVTGAANGNRDKALHWAACRATEQGAGAGVFDALEAAAIATGLTPREVRATIRSAQKGATPCPLGNPAGPPAPPPMATGGRLDDTHMSVAVAGQLAGRYLWSAGRGWMRSDGRYWEAVAEPVVAETVKQELLAFFLAEVAAGADDDRIKRVVGLLSAHRIYAILRLTKGVMAVDDSDWDTHPDLLNVANGVVDLRDGSLLPHDPGYMFTKLCPTEYRKGATHSDWTEALEAAPADVRDWLQIRLGQGLTGHPPTDDVDVFLEGSGENGKSTIVIGMLEAVGAHYAVLVPDRVLLAQPGDHPTEKMELWGARLAILEELPEGHLNVRRVKSISGPRMNGRYCAKDNVSWNVTHTLFITTNHTPRVDETDHGTWRRLLRVPFPYRYRKPGEPIERKTDRPADAGLRDRIKFGKDKQHEAVLAWLVAGAVEYYRAGFPPPPQSVLDSTRAWRGTADILLQFLDDAVWFTKDSHMIATDLLHMFNQWLQARGHTTWGDQTFAARMAQHPQVLKYGAVAKRVLRTRAGLHRPTFAPALGVPERYRAWVGLRPRMPADGDVQQ